MCRGHIEQSLELADALIAHSDQIRSECDDDGCLTLDGVIRDCGLTIRRMALKLKAEMDGEPPGPPAEEVKRTV
jgi:hypothetical protein